MIQSKVLDELYKISKEKGVPLHTLINVLLIRQLKDARKIKYKEYTWLD